MQAPLPALVLDFGAQVEASRRLPWIPKGGTVLMFLAASLLTRVVEGRVQRDASEARERRERGATPAVAGEAGG